jgi:hypothetical protein
VLERKWRNRNVDNGAVGKGNALGRGKVEPKDQGPCTTPPK